MHFSQFSCFKFLTFSKLIKYQIPVLTNWLSDIETPKWGEAKVTNKFILDFSSDKCFTTSLAITPPNEYPKSDIFL